MRVPKHGIHLLRAMIETRFKNFKQARSRTLGQLHFLLHQPVRSHSKNIGLRGTKCLWSRRGLYHDGQDTFYSTSELLVSFVIPTQISFRAKMELPNSRAQVLFGSAVLAPNITKNSSVVVVVGLVLVQFFTIFCCSRGPGNNTPAHVKHDLHIGLKTEEALLVGYIWI